MLNPDKVISLASSANVALVLALLGYPLMIGAIVKLYRDKEKLVNMLAETLRLNWMARGK